MVLSVEVSWLTYQPLQKTAQKRCGFFLIQTSMTKAHLLNLGVCDFGADSSKQRSSSLFIARTFLLFRSRRNFLGHFTLTRLTFPTANLNRSVFQRCRTECYVFLTWQQQLEDLSVVQTLQNCLKHYNLMNFIIVAQITCTDSPLIWVIRSPGRSPLS